MARRFILFFILYGVVFIAPPALQAQKEDYVWILGGGVRWPEYPYWSMGLLDFSETPFRHERPGANVDMFHTNTSICDKDGKLFCYSNGNHIYDATYKIAKNGASLYPGWTKGVQGYPLSGYILLPIPGTIERKIFIYGNNTAFVYRGKYLQSGYDSLKYAIVDRDSVTGLAEVVERDQLLMADSFSTLHMTACRHGNGRDWWVAVWHFQGDTVFWFLLEPQGIRLHHKQPVKAGEYGSGQVCFSPDGRWYARFNWHGITNNWFSTFDIYPFDRCQGLLGEPVSKTYNPGEPTMGRPGGVAFSPNSRFLYVSRWDTIYQYDLQASDILASEQMVAAYDGFREDVHWFPTRFYLLLLAPDNRIYCSVPNINQRYLHVIDKPDLPGPACSVLQHSVELSVANNYLLPNIPYYRLYDWHNSPCDTLGIDGPYVSVSYPAFSERFERVWPNPASSELFLRLSEPLQAVAEVQLFHATGQLALSRTLAAGLQQAVFSVSDLPDGHYFLLLRTKDGRLFRHKVVILH